MFGTQVTVSKVGFITVFRTYGCCYLKGGCFSTFLLTKLPLGNIG